MGRILFQDRMVPELHDVMSQVLATERPKLLHPDAVISVKPGASGGVLRPKDGHGEGRTVDVL